jgi:hypothetical protein
MHDDDIVDICNGKHRGPVVLYQDEKVVVTRCSFCELVYTTRNEPTEKSSKLCIQACDWVTCDKTVRCNSCGYHGPLP